MDEHFIYSRPVAVTEDKIKEALAKQANQKALKAALDQQVLEAERLKAEAHRAKGKNARRTASNKTNATSEGQAEQRADPGPSPAPLPLPSPPNSSDTHAGPSNGIEPTRYTFSFKQGQGTFEVTDKSIRPLQETLQPSSAEGRARAGSGDGGSTAVPFPLSNNNSNNGEKRRNLPIPAPARRTPSSRDSARGGVGKRKVSPSAAAGAGGAYQTNSLPANFRVGKDAGGGRATASRERVGSGDSRLSRGASRERGAARRPAASDNSDGNGGYDTQSLPVELIYKLSQGGGLPSASGGNANGQSPLSRLKPPHPPRLTSPKRSPSVSRISDSMAIRSPLSPPSIPSGSPGSAVRDRSSQVSPRGGRPGLGNAPSARPAGGFLPPLSGRRDSDVIEMSAVLDARTPTRSPRRRTSSTPMDRPLAPLGASPPNDNAAAAEQARKQSEREKGWAQQVKQLKSELRKARQKAAGKAGGGGKVDEGSSKAPRRAETAPDPPAHPPGRAPRGLGGVRQHQQQQQRRGENVSGDNVGPARPTRLEKMDFSKAHIFSRETFRPITAPEDASSYFGGLLGSPPPPRTPLPLVQPKPSPPPASVFAEAREPAAKRKETFSPLETELAALKSNTQSSAHTATSGDESLKLASLTTRQITLGLPDYGDGEPVPIQFLHLHQFVEAQIITAAQADGLWEFFALAVPADFDGSGGGDGGDEGHLHRAEGGNLKPSSAEADRYAVPHHADRAEAEGMTSQTIEIEEIPRDWASPHARDGETVGVGDDEGGEEEEEEEEGFFTPHSPAHPPTNAVLAPALRRKISQLHSEEAALLLQHHQQLRNGRQRPAIALETAPVKAALKKRNSNSVSPESRGRASPPPKPSPPKASSHSPHRDSEGSEPEGTFDTYSELKLSRNLLVARSGEEQL